MAGHTPLSCHPGPSRVSEQERVARSVVITAMTSSTTMRNSAIAGVSFFMTCSKAFQASWTEVEISRLGPGFTVLSKLAKKSWRASRKVITAQALYCAQRVGQTTLPFLPHRIICLALNAGKNEMFYAVDVRGTGDKWHCCWLPCITAHHWGSASSSDHITAVCWCCLKASDQDTWRMH